MGQPGQPLSCVGAIPRLPIGATLDFSQVHLHLNCLQIGPRLSVDTCFHCQPQVLTVFFSPRLPPTPKPPPPPPDTNHRTPINSDLQRRVQPLPVATATLLAGQPRLAHPADLALLLHVELGARLPPPAAAAQAAAQRRLAALAAQRVGHASDRLELRRRLEQRLVARIEAGGVRLRGLLSERSAEHPVRANRLVRRLVDRLHRRRAALLVFGRPRPTGGHSPANHRPSLHRRRHSPIALLVGRPGRCSRHEPVESVDQRNARPQSALVRSAPGASPAASFSLD